MLCLANSLSVGIAFASLWLHPPGSSDYKEHHKLEEHIMKPFTVHRGRVAPLDRVNVDTDQIIPKQFLKRIENIGFGQFLFYDWRDQ